MSRASAWRGSSAPNAAWRDGDRTYDVARLIAEQATSITVERKVNGVKSTLAAQTVRLDYMSDSPAESFTDTASLAALGVVVLGYKNHPTIADTDLQRGDRFFTGGRLYEVVEVFPLFSDRLVARAEAS